MTTTITTSTTTSKTSKVVVRHKSLTTTTPARNRRTAAEYAELDQAIVEVCRADNPLSVRGVFYRVMSAGVVAKTEKEYGVVQRRVLKLRRDGALPYGWIADGSRWHVKSPSWDSVEQALHDTAISYRRALWSNQNTYVEIWSEKEAVSSIVSPVTDSYDVPLMIARGFASETFLYATASTIRAVGKPTVVYQLGDHDPSGVAAWRHVQVKLREFAPDVEILFERIAVTEDQITTLNLPTRPTKATDSRAKTFAGESVEVDAIPTRILRDLVDTAITRHIDPIALEATRVFEREERQGLLAMARGWSV
ncbi:hypothetical protein [Nocardioides humi]|uniref:DUF2399 domain-containing protein n=1 Tax=Nocardioides humi TaxID=449461 RepID=A0ABN2BME1_9ACTN|nr:hypothetical protein [Nocardioides humi]